MRKKKQICCLLAAAIIFGAVWLEQGQQGFDGSAVQRGNYGEDETSYELLVTGLGEEEIPVMVTVSSRKRQKDEAQKMREEWVANLPREVLQENVSLQEIRSDLNLITYDDTKDLKLEWESEDSELIDSFGRVYNEELPPEGRRTGLRLTISDERGTSEFQLPVCIFPPVLSDVDKKKKGFLKAFSSADQASQEEEWVKLPEDFEGKPLSYRMKKDYSSFLILAIGVGLAVLYGFEDQIRQKERDKKRKEQLALEYSEIASKLQIYLGAGMTVRTAWERMAVDYKHRQAREQKLKSPAYEEVVQVCTDLQSGVSESEAYRRFGRRCGLRPYMKLAGLLEQNRKTGLKNLRHLLDDEVMDAFEERKNLAKRQGEEAATKLLLPLFLMLGIVMVIVAVPAFLSFY